jgi:hypothetical protein
MNAWTYFLPFLSWLSFVIVVIVILGILTLTGIVVVGLIRVLWKGAHATAADWLSTDLPAASTVGIIESGKAAADGE